MTTYSIADGYKIRKQSLNVRDSITSVNKNAICSRLFDRGSDLILSAVHCEGLTDGYKFKVSCMYWLVDWDSFGRHGRTN